MAEDQEYYVISVAAELAGMHAQTLRQYDRLGIVTPSRTSGGGRRYSYRDIEMLRDSVRAFAEAEIAPRADEIDRTNTFPRDLWVKLGELGLHGTTIRTRPASVASMADRVGAEGES